MKRPVRFGWIFAVCVFAAALWLAPQGDEAPLTLEDVVRMHVSGTDRATILEQIRTREVDLDLSPEMLQELRLAGVPSELIEALERRQAAIEKAKKLAAGEPVADEPLAGPELKVLLVPRRGKQAADADAEGGAEGDDDADAEGGAEGADGEEEEPGKSRRLVYPGVLLDPATIQAHNLSPDDPAGLRIGDIGIFLACTKATHVPDQWRAKSPLGRDFVAMPRHRMLAFASGARRLEEGEVAPHLRSLMQRVVAAMTQERQRPSDEKLPDFLELEAPGELIASLDPKRRGEPHNLMLGLAVQVNGKFIALTVAQLDGVEVGDEGTVLRASVWSKFSAGLSPIGVEFHRH